MSSPCKKFETLILHIVMEGTVSQNYNLSLGFDFIDFRGQNASKYHRMLPVFSNRIKTKP